MRRGDGEAAVKDFFVSYNQADRSWAEWIAWHLEEGGYTVVIQAWDFRPGANFVLEMQRAATEAARTIAVLSPDYLAARFTQPEWAAAFAQDPTGEKGTLLPVRVRACDLAGLLPQIIRVDLVGQDETAAKEALLAGVRRGRAKPATPPGFPRTAPRLLAERPPFPPGALPPIWNVPFRRNPNFTGREPLLADLRTALTSGQPAALTQAISGLGGVGKTQLALEYAYRHTADYAVVWWVRAEEPAALSADFAALAGPLNLPEKEATEQPVVVGAARRWLEHNNGWLLVFDNAPDPAALRDFLPQGGAGHVLITSRYPAWRGVASPLSVRVLDRAESVAFLLRRTGQTDQAAAGVLAGELGDLPLALEQAGAYIEATGRALADYLNLFRQRQGDLLSRGQPSTDYPSTVATTWEISFQQIQQTSPAGADLLNLCAFLAPDDIRRELLGEGAAYLPESLAAAVTDPLAWDEALAALRRYSMVEVSGDALAVHRLVQAVARDRLAEETRRTWAGAAVRVVNGAFPFEGDDVQTWPKCARLLPHTLAALSHAEALRVAAEATGRLLNQAGLYLLGRAEFAEAKAAFEQALAIGEAALGTENPKVGSIVNNLGSVLQALGDLAGARAAFQRALAIDEAAYGPEHPEVATDINNLGDVLRKQGDLVGARAAFQRALAIGEAALGPEHPKVAIRVNNLGLVLWEQGDLAGARAAFQRALAIDEAAYGPEHPAVATRVSNLGLVLQALGDLAGARAAFQRALAIDEAAYGLEHPEVARDVNNLGLVLRDLGDLAGARAAFQRALGIFQRFLGEDHPNTVTVRSNLVSLGELGDS